MIFQKMKLENLVKLQHDKDYLSTVIKISPSLVTSRNHILEF